MFLGAIIVFCILFIFLAACILPWWFFPVVIVLFIVCELLFDRKW